MRDRLYAYLQDRPDGATVTELLDLLFTQPGRDPEFGPRFLHAFLSPDPRFEWDASLERWRLRRHRVFMQPIREARFTIVDLETTGLNADPDGIIEIGAVRVERGQIVGRFEQLVRPAKPPPPFIVQLTGITPAMLRDQPPLADVWRSFCEFVSDSVVVAHNASFDLAYLNLAAQRFDGRPLAEFYLCTLKLTRRLFPELRRRGLDALVEFFGIPQGRRHRALGDVEITCEVFFRLLDRAEQSGISRVGQLLSLQSQGRDGRPFFSPLPRWQVESLPARAGVYRFYDEHDRLLYIGRAKNLRRRVASYLSNSSGHSDRTLDLVRHAHRLQAEVFPNELEAAIAEAQAIRREKPPYNRLGKHLPRTAYLRIGTERPFPRISIVSRPRGKRARFIGPLRDRIEAERLLKMLLRVYRLRTCAGKLSPDPAATPCLQGQLQLCSMPCAVAISVAEYRQAVEAAVENFFQNCEPLRLALETRRVHCAEQERFEAAQRLQDDLVLLDRLQARFRTLGWLTNQQHFLLVLPSDEPGEALAYWVHHGVLISRTRAHSLAEFAAWWENLPVCSTQLRPDAVDASCIIAAWLRDRTAVSHGYVFRVGHELKERPATLDKEWQAAILALLGQTAVSP